MGNEPKISSTDGALMIGAAAFFDLVQVGASLFNIIPGLGLVLNKFVSIFAILTFFVWLAIKGASMKSMWILFGAGGAELLPIPFLSALPFFLGCIIAIIIKERAKKFLPKGAAKVLTK